MAMKSTISEPFRDIFHLSFENTEEMAQAFLRFQEHYESPEFRGKIFTLDEFKAWYIAQSTDSERRGEFTYYDDWQGFNVPSHVFEPFFEGKFDPLSKAESALLDAFKQHREKVFYVIASSRSEEDNERTSIHETGHGFFHVSAEYRESVLSIIRDIDADTKKAIDALLATFGGYHPAVFDDETHAYLLTDRDFFKDEGDIDHPSLIGVASRLRENYDRFAKILRNDVS